MFTRALVLGATGMIGCHAVHAGLRRATRVRALVRPGSDARILADLDLEIARGDLHDRASLAAALEGCDLLIHAAAAYPKRHFGATAFLASARAGMENLILACEAAGGGLRRVVYVSSVTTIGRPVAGAAGKAARRRSPTDPPLARESDTQAIEDPSPYFRVKAMMEGLARAAAGRGLPLVIVNPTFCVDEFDDHRSTAQLLVPLAKGMLPAFVPGRLNAVATRDVGEGIWLAAERGGIGARYILGGENITSREFLERCARIAGVAAPRLALPIGFAEGASYVSELIARLTGTRPLFPMAGVRMIKHSQHYDITLARAQLGFTPTSIDDAIERAYAWYRTRHFL